MVLTKEAADVSERDIPATIIRKPRIREENDGNRLLFECLLLGLPRPLIEWYKGDRKITLLDGRFQTKLQEVSPNRYVATLDLVDVVGEDKGQYRICATNKEGQVSAAINLTFTRKYFAIHLIVN
jgi:hypothetical protein